MNRQKGEVNHQLYHQSSRRLSLRPRELMNMGTGGSHQLKYLCTDRTSMLQIKPRTSGLTELLQLSVAAEATLLLTTLPLTYTVLSNSATDITHIRLEDFFLLPEGYFMPHCRSYLGIVCYLSTHLSTFFPPLPDRH